MEKATSTHRVNYPAEVEIHVDIQLDINGWSCVQCFVINIRPKNTCCFDIKTRQHHKYREKAQFTKYIETGDDLITSNSFNFFICKNTLCISTTR